MSEIKELSRCCKATLLEAPPQKGCPEMRMCSGCEKLYEIKAGLICLDAGHPVTAGLGQCGKCRATNLLEGFIFVPNQALFYTRCQVCQTTDDALKCVGRSRCREVSDIRKCPDALHMLRDYASWLRVETTMNQRNWPDLVPTRIQFSYLGRDVNIVADHSSPEMWIICVKGQGRDSYRVVDLKQIEAALNE